MVDLMDISVFQIALHKKLLIIYTKYPIRKNSEIYYARAIFQTDKKQGRTL